MDEEKGARGGCRSAKKGAVGDDFIVEKRARWSIGEEVRGACCLSSTRWGMPWAAPTILAEHGMVLLEIGISAGYFY